MIDHEQLRRIMNLANSGSSYDQIDAILSDISAQGYVIVPREPTEAMIEAGYNAIIEYEEMEVTEEGIEIVWEWTEAKIAFRAMIEAANPPTPEKAE